MDTNNTYNTTLDFDNHAQYVLAERAFRLIGIEHDYIINQEHNEKKTYRSAYMVGDITNGQLKIKGLTEVDVQSFSDYHEVLELINYFDSDSIKFSK